MSRKRSSPLITILVVVCLGLIAFAFAVPNLERIARSEITLQLREKLDARVELRAVHVASLWPLGLRLQGLKILPNKGRYHVEVDQANLRFRYFSGQPIELNIEHPTLNWAGESSAGPPAGTATLPSVTASKLSLRTMITSIFTTHAMQVNITEGLIVWVIDPVNEVRLEKLHLTLLKNRIFDENEPLRIQLTAEARFKTPWISGQTDVVGASSDLRLTSKEIISKVIELQVGGLDMRANGVSKFDDGLHDWIVQASNNDLAKSQTPLSFLPARNWRGKIQLDVAVHGNKKSVLVHSNVHMDHVSMDMQWDSPQYKIHGPVVIDTQAKFKWQDSKFEFKDASFLADLTNAEVKDADILAKPSGVPLTLNFQGSFGSKAIAIQEFEANLFNLKVLASGSLPESGSGRIQFQMPTVSLAGWEKLAPALTQSPLSGTMELKGILAGSMQHPEALAVEFSRFSLKDWHGNLKYRSFDGFSTLQGPFALDVDGRWSSLGAVVKSASVQAQADLSQMAIHDQGVFDKEPTEPLIFRAQALAANQKLKTHVHFDGLKLETIFALFFHSMIDVGKGAIKGDIDLETPAPGVPDFWAQSRVNSQIKSDHAWISPLGAQRLCGVLLESPKGDITVPPFQGPMDGQFQWDTQKFEKIVWNIVDPGGDELHVKGNITTDNKLDLEGQFMWSKPPLSDCYTQGRTDRRGRMTVPFLVQGTVGEPFWTVAAEYQSIFKQATAVCAGPKGK